MSGRQGDRHAAQEALGRLDTDGRRKLRLLILDSLTSGYPLKKEEADDWKATWDRSWLLSSLGRISQGDQGSMQALLKHLQPDWEPSNFVRFWTFEGLVAANSKDLADVARQIETETRDIAGEIDSSGPNEERLWLRRLAVAVLAAKKSDADARNEIEHALVSSATLRALRFVPIPALVEPISNIVGGDVDLRVQHNAVRALGSIPCPSAGANFAARRLADFVSNVEDYGAWDSMRAIALQALGNLKVEGVATTIMVQLEDDDPSIVRAAAQALEKCLGTATATRRLVERVASRKELAKRYGKALGWMDQAATRELESIIASGSLEEQELARILLAEMGGPAAFRTLLARTRATNDYLSALEQAEAKLRDMFDQSIRDARTSFRLANGMDVVVFGLGIFLIAISALLVLLRTGSLENWVGAGVTGAAGVLGVLYTTLVANPRDRLKSTSDHLTHQKIVFLGYLRQLHQIDTAYTRAVLEGEMMSAGHVREFSDMVRVMMSGASEELARPPPAPG